MSDIVIECAGLGKRYRLGRRLPYHRMSELMVSTAMAPWRILQSVARVAGQGQQKSREIQDGYFWALKDLNFELRKGEVLGVIGRNGAGKSTLFKLLSRITEPTTGQVAITGRVGALLEVGTGFHPELTGRENVFLNGAILGMTSREIRSQFDEIVAFAEVSQFIDTPVKRYSSGMRVRLAFAVAAHLNPEILIVDEVLAVGDVAFQKKCLGRMSEIAKSGRTVLFVSHSMPAVRMLCTKAMVLASGSQVYYGDVAKAVEICNQAAEMSAGEVDLQPIVNRNGNKQLRMLRFWAEDQQGNKTSVLTTGQACTLAVEYESTDGLDRKNICMVISINTTTGMLVAVLAMHTLNPVFDTVPPRGVILMKIPKLSLAAGRYVLDLTLGTHSGQDHADSIQSAAALDVDEGDYYGTGRSEQHGATVMMDASWELRV